MMGQYEEMMAEVSERISFSPLLSALEKKVDDMVYGVRGITGRGGISEITQGFASIRKQTLTLPDSEREKVERRIAEIEARLPEASRVATLELATTALKRPPLAESVPVIQGYIGLAEEYGNNVDGLRRQLSEALAKSPNLTTSP